MIRRSLETELDHEKELLKKLNKTKDRFSNTLLIRSGGYFYYFNRGEKKRHYLRKHDLYLFRRITQARYNREMIRILTNNIKALTSALKRLKDYDDHSVVSSLPDSYSSAIRHLRTEEAKGSRVIQSQNHFRANDLVITCSNGLVVRTREEAIIVEILLSLDINFRYEKALVLNEYVTMSDGSVRTFDKTVYPDFTIFLADGSEFYIEHAGRMDDPGYREQFYKRFELYLINGIHSPKNLFISMASPTMPIDAQLIRKVIETQILPLC